MTLWKKIINTLEEGRKPDSVELERWAVEAQSLQRRLDTVVTFQRSVVESVKEAHSNGDPTGFVKLIETIVDATKRRIDQKLRFDPKYKVEECIEEGAAHSCAAEEQRNIEK